MITWSKIYQLQTINHHENDRVQSLVLSICEHDDQHHLSEDLAAIDDMKPQSCVRGLAHSVDAEDKEEAAYCEACFDIIEDGSYAHRRDKLFLSSLKNVRWTQQN